MRDQSKSSIYQQRILIVMAVIGAVFLILFGRLWYIQITRGDYFRDQAEKNRLRIIDIPAPRGLILDRKGRVLVDNEISFSLILRREYMKDKARLLDVLERHLGLERAHVEKKLEEFRLVPTVFPIPLKNRLDFAEIAFVEAHRDRFPELSLEWIPTRRYVLGPMASHIFGYVGEVTPEELAQPAFQSLAPGDIVGKAGLERFYNARVKGTKGQEKVFINSIGQITRVVEKIPAQKGQDLPISIDLEIQKKAEEMMEGQKGAVVAIDPRSGEVLCMVSKPEFDPNLFIGHLSRQQWQELLDDPDKPLQNKVIQGTFAPGSIFKILVASAALGENLIDPQTTFYCPGQTEMLGRIVHCWNASGHGSVQLMEAITNSCNIYFYNVGLKVGVDRIHNWAVRMGLGIRSGIDLPGERAGLVPSSEWKQKTYGQPWYQGETVSVAIGQGAVNVTPLQVACFMCAISTNAPPQIPHFLLNPGPPPAETGPRPPAAGRSGGPGGDRHAKRHRVRNGHPRPSRRDPDRGQDGDRAIDQHPDSRAPAGLPEGVPGELLVCVLRAGRRSPDRHRRDRGARRPRGDDGRPGGGRDHEEVFRVVPSAGNHRSAGSGAGPPPPAEPDEENHGE